MVYTSADIKVENVNDICCDGGSLPGLPLAFSCACTHFSQWILFCTLSTRTPFESLQSAGVKTRGVGTS